MNYITKCAQRTVFSEVHSDLMWVYLVLVWKRNLVCIVHTHANEIEKGVFLTELALSAILHK